MVALFRDVNRAETDVTKSCHFFWAEAETSTETTKTNTETDTDQIRYRHGYIYISEDGWATRHHRGGGLVFLT
jgi:hypothetical protein